jgi:uncharacterized protein (DUF58 family)
MEVTRKIDLALKRPWRFMGVCAAVVATLCLIDNLFGVNTNYVAGKTLFALLFLYFYASAIYYLFRSRLHVSPHIRRGYVTIRVVIGNALFLLTVFLIWLGVFGVE